MTEKTTGRGLAEPPEGALAGEDVPRENDEHEARRATVETLKGALRSRGEPYASMTDAELEERALSRMED